MKNTSILISHSAKVAIAYASDDKSTHEPVWSVNSCSRINLTHRIKGLSSNDIANAGETG
jgi:pterin-4a-carbinolamine dehydratase